MIPAKINFLRKLTEYFDSLGMDLCGKGLCVCLSGGADSVSLLRGLMDISSKYGFNIYACHFNHMIRGEESDRDEDFCRDLCDSLGITLYRGWHDVPEYAKYYKLSLEEAARDCRYAFFQRVSSRECVDYCVTAHNMNDDAETLLFNLIRGSGLNGATAIAPKKDIMLRPLLKIKRSEIEEYLTEIGQTYVNDSTNASTEYSRNYIRHQLIPDMEALNPSVVEALSRYISSCRNDREYFDSIVEQNIDMKPSSLPKAIRDRVIIKKYKLFSNYSLNSEMVNEIDKALVSSIRTIIPLYSDTEALIDNGNLIFRKKSEKLEFTFDSVSLKDGENDLFGNRVLVILSEENHCHSENFNKISITKKLSFDNIKDGLNVRNRRVGDKILINGMHKSLKKLFIEKRVPAEYRNIIPVICDGEEIVYVPFVAISDKVVMKNSQNNKYVTTILNNIDTERWKIAYEK